MKIMGVIEEIVYDYKHYSKDKKGINKIIVLFYYPGLQGLFIYRVLNYLYINSDNKLFALLYKLLFLILYIPFKNITGVEIHPEAKIGKGLYLPHGHSVVISKKAIIGNHVIIHQNCTIGINYNTGEAPVIGDNVFIGANSTLIGGIKIGDNCTILCNSSVVNSFPNNSLIGGVPAKKIERF
jgi:serine O-acetyltransferase